MDERNLVMINTSEEAEGEGGEGGEQDKDSADCLIDTGSPQRPLDNESRTEKALFTPALSIQRYQRVCDLATKYRVKSVLDLGCGECRLIQRVKNVDLLERITGVDIDKTPLMMSKLRCRPLMSDHLCPRSKPLVIELYQGDITVPDSRIANHEMVSLVEVVEHLVGEDLAKLPEAVFGALRPKYCVVTTPNSEYNILFENFEGMRHWDHKFEWNRHDFEEWAEGIASKYGYAVQFDGVGDPPPDNHDVGFCTQIAIFERLQEPDQPITDENYTEPDSDQPISDENYTEPDSDQPISDENYTEVDSDQPIPDEILINYTLICREVYPYRTEQQKLREKLCQELERIIPKLSEDNQLNKIRLDSLYEDSLLNTLCERQNLVAMLREVGYELTEDEECLIIDRREECYSSDGDSGGQFSDADEDESLEIVFDNWKSIELEVWD